MCCHCPVLGYPELKAGEGWGVLISKATESACGLSALAGSSHWGTCGINVAGVGKGLLSLGLCAYWAHPKALGCLQTLPWGTLGFGFCCGVPYETPMLKGRCCCKELPFLGVALLGCVGCPQQCCGCEHACAIIHAHGTSIGQVPLGARCRIIPGQLKLRNCSSPSILPNLSDSGTDETSVLAMPSAAHATWIKRKNNLWCKPLACPNLLLQHYLFLMSIAREVIF